MSAMTRLLGWVVLCASTVLLGCQSTPPPLPTGPDGEPLVLDERTLLVDGELSRDWPDRHRFHTLHAAVEAAPPGTEARPTRIYLAPNVYWMQGTESDRGLYIDKDWVRLIGLSEDPRDVVLADNRGHTIGAYSRSGSSPAETLFVTGTGFGAENLTIGNYCNVDLVYPRDPSKNRDKRSDTITQAYAIGAANPHKTLDHFVFRNVRFVAMLDTLALAEVKRAYFEDVYVQGTDDFIGGGDMHVFKNSVIRSYTSKPLFSAGDHGTAFIDSRWEVDFTDPQALWLSKRSSTVFLNNVEFVDRTGQLTAIHWSPYPDPSINSYQYRVTLDGMPYRLLPEAGGVPLTPAQASAYTAARLLAGEDGWNPTGEPRAAGSVDRALDVRLSGGSRLVSGGDGIVLSASVFPAGAETGLRWHSSSEALTLTPLDARRVSVRGRYDGESPLEVPVTVTAASGIENHRVVTLHPERLPAPAFLREPSLHIEADGRLRVDYELDLAYDGGRRPDHSRITWYRLPEDDEADPIPVAVTRGDSPLHRYRPSWGDLGHRLMAEVAPDHNRSDPGAPVRVRSARAIQRSDLPAGSRDRVTLRVREFPNSRQPALRERSWTRDTFYPRDQTVNWTARPVEPWVYGTGINGAEGAAGLLPAAQGARLLYTREGYRGDMEVSLTLDTEKTAAQGFGSPNGQYLEVYIGYDTRAQTGYALRIERTAKYAFASEFTLYRYDKGRGTPISESVSATAFNPGTRIRLRLRERRLEAEVVSERAQSSDQMAAGLPARVRLEAAAVPAAGGFGLQHTGTVGPGGRFVLHTLDARYERALKREADPLSH